MKTLLCLLFSAGLLVAQDFNPFTTVGMAALYWRATPGTPTLDAPDFSQPQGTYSNSVTVSITNTVAGSSYFWTTNGVNPTPASAAYTGPITFTTTDTNLVVNLRSIATNVNYVNSSITSSNYTITNAPSTPGPTNPASLSGLYLRLVYTNLATNIVSQNLTSTVNGFRFDAPTFVEGISNTAKGFLAGWTNNETTFRESTFSGVTFSNAHTVWYSCTPATALMGNPASLTVDYDGANGPKFGFFDGKASYYSGGASSWTNYGSAITNNGMLTVAWSVEGTNVTCYTNGVSAGTQYPGRNGMWLNRFFGLGDANISFGGYLQDFCVFTNGMLDAATISGLHRYAQTNYNFSYP